MTLEKPVFNFKPVMQDVLRCNWLVGRVCEWKNSFSASVGKGSMLELQSVKFFFLFLKKDDRILHVYALSYCWGKKIVCRRGSSRNKKNSYKYCDGLHHTYRHKHSTIDICVCQL